MLIARLSTEGNGDDCREELPRRYNGEWHREGGKSAPSAYGEGRSGSAEESNSEQNRVTQSAIRGSAGSERRQRAGGGRGGITLWSVLRPTATNAPSCSVPSTARQSPQPAIQRSSPRT